MPRYLAVVNQLLSQTLRARPDTLIYGENIDKGSCLCGVARGLPGRVVNVGNCENTHVGAGFGLLLGGRNSVLIMKQLDFLLLALDQIANTWNLIRCGRRVEDLGSFTIVVIVCDQGWQGPQSSFHGLSDICSLARAEGYTLNARAEAEAILAKHLVRPGFRMIGVSQAAFGEEMIDAPVLNMSTDLGVFQYSNGDDVTVAACNFTLVEAFEMERLLRERGRQAGVFSVHPGPDRDWGLIHSHVSRSGRLVVLDDGKGLNSFANRLARDVSRRDPHCRIVVETREEGVDSGVGADAFVLDSGRIAEEVLA